MKSSSRVALYVASILSVSSFRFLSTRNCYFSRHTSCDSLFYAENPESVSLLEMPPLFFDDDKLNGKKIGGYSSTKQSSAPPSMSPKKLVSLQPDSSVVPSLNSGSQKDEMSRWSARVLLLFVSALYGTNFGCVKILGESLEPSVAAFLRFSLSSLVFSPWLLPNLIARKEVVLAGLEVGLYTFVGYAAQAVALQTTKASTAAFLCSLVVVVVPLLDLLSHQYSSRQQSKVTSKGINNENQSPFFALFPALLAATGVGFLELGGIDTPGFGDILALGQPIFFGLAFWRTEKITRNFPQPDDTKIFTGACMSTIAFGAMVWAYFDFLRPLLAQGSEVAMASMQSHAAVFSDWHVPAAILWTGVVTTALTIYGENRAMVTLTAAESTVIYSTEPLWGTAFAALTLGEHIGGNMVAGAVLILASCLWSSLGAAVTTAGVISAIQASVAMPELLANIELNWVELVRKLEQMLMFSESASG